MELKDFQKRSLTALSNFFEKTRLLSDPERAYHSVTKDASSRLQLYRRISGLTDIPYVCIRIPTGGGKTIVGAHAIKVAGKSFVEKDYPVVLWLVPSNAIRVQTSDALKNPSHPYRKALDEAFGGHVKVFDIGDIDQIRPQDLVDRVCLIVGTIQTLRVEKTEGRNAYAHKEALEPHFTRLPADCSKLDKFDGKVKFSFANLMAIHRPMVIVDEAHNARTSLTFDVLSRLSPSCIVELSATPDSNAKTGSNVLYRVSASELKAEEMIKLPISLTEHKTSWQDAVTDARLQQKKLLELAKNEQPDHVRPILLIQAENKDKPANVDVVKSYLIEAEGIDKDHIAIATGEQRELDKVDLFDPNCKIEVIITVQALKEGWDCSFAYVFCSVANISSAKDVEQLLGRVLRMPYAKRRKVPELNKAYAHVSSPNFGEAARQLQDRLIAMGFEETEAQQFVENVTPSLFPDPEPLTLTVQTAPDLSSLSPAERTAVTVTKEAEGSVKVEITGEVSEALENVLVLSAPESEREAIKSKIAAHRSTPKPDPSPSQRGELFVVPRLCVRVQGELELAEKELILDLAGWNLLDHQPELPEFRFNNSTNTFEFDVDGNQVTYEYMGDQQLDLAGVETDWNITMLSRWLDRELQTPDVRQEVRMAWIGKALTYLVDRKKFDLVTLGRAKFILVRALADKIAAAKKASYSKGYQETLFAPAAAVETSFDYSFSFHPDVYPANWYYRGGFKFKKHYYPVPGELKNDGEEFECAQQFVWLKGVKYWVRNLETRPHSSFWLPTATDRFYPDFVALLDDGRLFVVEYKGGLTAQTDDTKEKRSVGELWESKSKGNGLFLIVEKKDSLGRNMLEQMEAKIRG